MVKKGMKYGRLLVVSRAESTRHGKRWNCICDCGTATVAYGNRLLSGQTRSCGCVLREKRHGKIHTRLYRIWTGMKTRCLNPNSDHFEAYMGRGITICEEWRSSFKAFYNWALANGYRDNLTIDRIDVNGNYEPSNCRWATIAVQNQNRSNALFIEYGGKIHTLREWEGLTGVKYQTLFWRYKHGWSPDEIINGKNPQMQK